MPTAPRILVADDNLLLAALACDAISQALPDAIIEVEFDGACALAAHTRNPVDLIVTDQHMPGLTGIELVRRLRRRNDATLVLLWSSDPLAASDARLAGADLFLDKSGSLHELVEAIARIIVRA
jgi:CheY-like chemotaxis protein